MNNNIPAELLKTAILLPNTDFQSPDLYHHYIMSLFDVTIPGEILVIHIAQITYCFNDSIHHY